MSIKASAWPEMGERVVSGYQEVHQFDSGVLETLAAYDPQSAWNMCDAFSTTTSGLLVPGEDTLTYQERMGWDLLPSDGRFQTAYRQVRDRVIDDAAAVLDSKALAVMIQLKHTGPNPRPLDDYDKVPHLDFVGLLGQRVLVYYLSNKAQVRIFTGNYPFQGFVEDYSDVPGFDELEERQPDANQLVRAEGITCIHAPDAPEPGRIFVRAFAEEVK